MKRLDIPSAKVSVVFPEGKLPAIDPADPAFVLVLGGVEIGAKVNAKAARKLAAWAGGAVLQGKLVSEGASCPCWMRGSPGSSPRPLPRTGVRNDIRVLCEPGNDRRSSSSSSSWALGSPSVSPEPTYRRRRTPRCRRGAGRPFPRSYRAPDRGRAADEGRRWEVSTRATTQPTTFGPPFEGFVPYRMPLAQHQLMVASGAFTSARVGADRRAAGAENDQGKGKSVGKHSAGSEKCWRAIDPRVPAGWHIRIEKPVRIPRGESMPEPDVSVARGVWTITWTWTPAPPTSPWS